jgi:hypothetical protein
MENLISFLVSALLPGTEKRGPGKITLGAPGCTLTVHTPPLVYQVKTEEGYNAFIGQSKLHDVTYGFATVFLPFQLLGKELQTNLFLMMQDVHASFDISFGTGLTYGYNHAGDNTIFGITEYWQDREGNDWKVKGWSNGSVMTVLYIKNIGSVSFKDQECYLDGISFSSSQKLLQ